MKYISILLASIALLCSGCSTDYETVQEKYAENYQAHLDKDRRADVRVWFETTYKNYTISLYDVQTGEYIFQDNKNIDITFDAKFKGRYIFSFDRIDGELITPQDEPYVWIHIKNMTDNKLIEEMEYDQCMLGYNNNFLVL